MTAVPGLAAWLREQASSTLEYARKNSARRPITPMRSHEMRDLAARCEAELAILDEHYILHRNIGWTEGPDEAWAEIPVCGLCVPKHSYYRSRADVPEGPCRTVRLLGSGYRHRDGYLEEWAP